jgi:hypothetical protein
VAQQAANKFNIPPNSEPTDEQVTAIEKEQMTAALRPFHNPKLRKALMDVKAAAEQVLDEVKARRTTVTMNAPATTLCSVSIRMETLNTPCFAMAMFIALMTGDRYWSRWLLAIEPRR